MSADDTAGRRPGLPGATQGEPMPRESSWYVLHVKPRTERKVMSRLALCGAWRYLPLLTKERRVQRRKVRVELPLFPGYVFARLDAARRLTMLKTNLLVRLIKIPNPRETIHQLRQIVHAGRLAPLTPRPTFTLGARVWVSAGPLYGFVGHIDALGHDLILSLDILGRAVSVSINPADCEPL